jgi:hypothetical protein
MVLLVVHGAAATKASSRPAVEFTLSDQEGHAREVKYPREKVSVFVLADQKASSEIAGIAALPGIPSAFHGLFRREFKKRLRYPVMLDWSGEVARAHGYPQQQAQLLVVSRRGRIALSKTGPATAPALAEVYAAIDRLHKTR